MDYDAEAISKIFLDLLPTVLSDIILEYLLAVKHNFVFIGSVEQDNLQGEYCIDDNKMYMYNNRTLTIILLTDKNKYMTQLSKKIAIYNNNIYVGVINDTEESILVFNKQCELIREIDIKLNTNGNNKKRYNSNHMIMIVTADKIFTTCIHDKIIQMNELYGNFIKNIQITSTVYNMITDGISLFVLDHEEHICEYSLDGKMINDIFVPGERILNFCVIDGSIYKKLQWKRGIYNHSGKCIADDDCIIYSEEMIFVDNILYISELNVNMFSVLEKKNKKLII